jgi:NADPH:quinone reductase-like Zn-dependent oxidoreductase
MKAIVCNRYGSPDVLEMQDIEKPDPGDNEVLIKVHSAALNAADWHIMRGSPYLMRFVFGFKGPKYPVPGSDAAGYVEAIGKDVTRFKRGDAVFGNLFDDGKSEKGFGAFAEYACADEQAFVLKPSNLTFEEAASIPLAATTALQALDMGRAEAGKKVLVNGASGGVGTFTVQIAKARGCEVTAVCSRSKTDMVRSIGADHIINYEQVNVTKSGMQYDVVIAANGYHPISDYKRILTPRGHYVSVGGNMSQMFQGIALGPLLSERHGKQLGYLSAKTNLKDLVTVAQVAASGKIKPVIDRAYTLSEVADAMRYLEEGHASGKIVIHVA